MKFGAEPRKIAFLSILGLVLGYVVYDNVFAGPDYGPAPVKSGQPTSVTGIPAPVPAVSGAIPPPNLGRRGRTAMDFRPSLRPRTDEVRDPATIDPTLHLDLLAKLRNVTYNGAGRNLFEFGAAPPPPPTTPDPKIIPGRKAGPQRVKAIYPLYEPPPPPPPKPRAPAITMKYYGFVSNSGSRNAPRRGFFLDGEDIIVVSEGEVIKNRYKVLRIGLTSAEMQDIQFADDRQQLPLVPDPAGD